jgi:hypothetical protein
VSDTITIALISAGGTFLTAVTALILNMRMFSSLERRIGQLEVDNQEFFRWFGRIDADLRRIDDRIGLES